MKTVASSKQVRLAVIVILLGCGCLVMSNSMVNDIDRAPIPDAIERWGPDGYSYGHDMFAILGCAGVFGLSIFIELLVGSVSERGLTLARWFVFFSFGILALSALLVLSCWSDWQEAQIAIKSEQIIAPDR